MLRSRCSVFAVLSCVAFALVPTACAGGDDVGGVFDGGGKSDSKVDIGKDSPPVDSPVGDTPPGDTTPVDDSGCTPPSGSTCGVYPQCGCASTEKCDVTGADGTTSCSPDGTLGLNERCDTGSCMKGFACIGSKYGAICRPYCSSDASCSGSKKGVCKNIQSAGTPPVDIPGFKTCFVSCDPLNPSTSCGLSSCSFFDGTTTTCVAAGTGKTAGSCGSTNPLCAPGYICVGTGDCKKWCRMTGSDCGGGTCGAITIDTAGTKPSYMGTEYGVCP